MKPCEHCGNEFIPKRSDAAFCSSSCRQMSYIQRKNNLLPSFNKSENVGSIEERHTLEKQNADEGTNLINKDISTNKSTAPINSNEYVQIESRFLDGLHELMNVWRGEHYLNRRHYTGFPSNEIYVYSRYRCFCDYLLKFSEQPSVLLNHLKELHNALVFVSKTTEFLSLEGDNPFVLEIKDWRERLKNCILNHLDTSALVFRLGVDLRRELICSRYALAQYFKKRSFSSFKFMNLSNVEKIEMKKTRTKKKK
jgi:hypothetical protein